MQARRGRGPPRGPSVHPEGLSRPGPRRAPLAPIANPLPGQCRFPTPPAARLQAKTGPFPRLSAARRATPGSWGGGRASGREHQEGDDPLGLQRQVCLVGLRLPAPSAEDRFELRRAVLLDTEHCGVQLTVRALRGEEPARAVHEQLVQLRAEPLAGEPETHRHEVHELRERIRPRPPGQTHAPGIDLPASRGPRCPRGPVHDDLAAWA